MDLILPGFPYWLRPLWLWMLPAILVGAWFIWQATYQAWRGVVDPALLRKLLVYNKSRAQHGLAWLWWGSLGMLLLALAGPSFHDKVVPVFQKSRAIVLVVDQSEAMLAQDWAPTRLARSQFKLQDMLKRYPAYRYGLIAYAGSAHVVAPITTDGAILLSLVQALHPSIMPQSGHRLDLALQKAHHLLTQARVEEGWIILLTSESRDGSALEVAKQIKKAGYHLAILGVGSTEGAPMAGQQGFIQDKKGQVVFSKRQDDALKALASAGGGVYGVMEPDDRDLERLFASMKGSKEQTQETALSTKQRQDDGYWLIWIAAMGFLGCMRRGWLEWLVR